MSRIHNGSSDIIEILIRDSSGAKIEGRIANSSDKNAVDRLFRWLRDKFGITERRKEIVKEDGGFLNY